MTDLNDLVPLAQRLNAATDDLNQILETIQEGLNALALGVEAWLDSDEHELGRQVTGAWGELGGSPVTSWPEDVGEHVRQVRSVQRQELGYGRLGDGWALLVRTANYIERKHDDRWIVQPGEQGTEQERKPLLRSARNIRVRAVDLIPDLIGKLRKEASGVIDAVEKARQIADSLRKGAQPNRHGVRLRTQSDAARKEPDKMNLSRVKDSLNKIERASQQIEGADAEMANYTGHIRAFVDEIRAEVNPPADANAERTRDQISAKEWAEYEWHDVTAMGDSQRKYVRGLKR
jgi:hypothetical protein